MREMKDSGVAWIGEMPSGWNLYKIKNLGRYINGFPFKPEDWGTIGRPIIRIQDLTGSNKEPNFYDGSIDEKYLVSNGDILVSWAATLDAFKWDGGEGWLNQHIFKAIPNTSVVKKDYFIWLLKTAMRYMNDDNKHGIMMQHVTLPVFNNFSVPMPSVDEQRRIAARLDAACSKVDALIANQQAQIEKLKVYKQSLITEVVTHGLNPDAPMKDSGVEWIGMIPQGWKTIRLKQLCSKIADGTHFSPQTTSEGYPYITAKDVDGKGINFNEAAKISEEDYISLVRAGCQPEVGDVLIVKDGATTGRVGISTDSTKFVLLSSVAMLHPADGCLQAFLMYLLMSNTIQNQIKLSMAGSAMPRTTLTKLAEYYGVLPTQAEQQQIVAYLDAKCAKIDALMTLKQSKIDKLTEYKKSLIYEYVTGKKEA